MALKVMKHFGLIVETLSIASSGVVSSTLTLLGRPLVALQFPTAFDGTTVNILASHDGSNFHSYYDRAGVQYAITVATVASRYILFDPTDFAGVPYLQLSTASQTGGARTVIAILRDVKGRA